MPRPSFNTKHTYFGNCVDLWLFVLLVILESIEVVVRSESMIAMLQKQAPVCHPSQQTFGFASLKLLISKNQVWFMMVLSSGSLTHHVSPGLVDLNVIYNSYVSSFLVFLSACNLTHCHCHVSRNVCASTVVHFCIAYSLHTWLTGHIWQNE